MKRVMLSVAGVIILFIAVDGVLAQGRGQGQRNAPRREIPASVRTPRQGASRQVDPNELAQRERARRQMREQIEQRSSQRRRQADQNEAADINAPGAKGRRELGGKGKDAMKQKAVATGEQHHQQLMAVEKQMQAEQAKHRERLARLSRIRELAQQQGDTKTVERVDKLIEKDQQRYEAKTQRMERRKNAMIKFQEKAAEEKTRGGDDADTNKP